jgi:hypothetical protein
MNYGPFLLKLIIVCQYIIIIETSLMVIMVLYLNGLFVFNKLTDLLKMAFFMLHRHILTTIIMTITIVVFIYIFVFYLNALFLLLFFSALCLWINVLYLPISKKYIKTKEEKPEHEQETK